VRRSAVAFIVIGVLAWTVQLLFAFGSLPAENYRSLAEATAFLLVVWVVGLACVGIVRLFSRRTR